MKITFDLLAILRGKFEIRIDLDERAAGDVQQDAPGLTALDAISDFCTERFARRRLIRRAARS